MRRFLTVDSDDATTGEVDEIRILIQVRTDDDFGPRLVWCRLPVDYRFA